MEFQATQENVKISGRTLWIDGVRYLSYSGSSISFTFTGKKAEAEIISDSPDWEEMLKGWIAVYINNEVQPRKRICLDAQRETYVLYESETSQQVQIRIVKYSEAAFGSCGICNLKIDADHLDQNGNITDDAMQLNKRKIEIIGDSITCGYGVEAENELQVFHTAQENPTKSYSLRTIKELHAEGNLVSWSGIGIISNFVPEDATAPLADWLMPMLYQYTDASMSKRLYGDDENKWEKWDFKQFIPDMIVINLGTNDASYCKDMADRREIFISEYNKFVDFVATKNASAQILCILGTMDQRLCDSVEKVVEMQKIKIRDRIHYLHLPEQNQQDGLGADYHPCALTQEKTAKIVVDKIRTIMNW